MITCSAFWRTPESSCRSKDCRLNILVRPERTADPLHNIEDRNAVFSTFAGPDRILYQKRRGFLAKTTKKLDGRAVLLRVL